MGPYQSELVKVIVTNRKEHMESTGVLFIATGKRYIQAGIRAAKTVHRAMPDLPIHLYANWKENGFRFDETPFPFTSVSEIENPHRRSKVDYLAKTPFEKTLYLDTDTAVVSDIRDIYDLLERFDIALCHAHRRNVPKRLLTWRNQLPEAFPQFNSGVFLYKKNAKVIDFLNQWSAAFHTEHFMQDQVTLRELLWLSDIRIATLPPEYNVRYIKYHFLWGKNEAKTKIFHLRKYHDGEFWYVTKPLKRLIKQIIAPKREPGNKK